MKKIRYILLPLSFLYGCILWLRNFLYNKGIFNSVSPTIKTISIGNISLGGTGKTPHIEYLLNLLADKKTAVLSRGYGRNTKGTFVVKNGSHANETGDEPLQIARKFPNVNVVVDGNRLRGIQYIEKHFPQTEIILLDDALQHRKLKAGLNVLLTTYGQPFTSDFYLPAGNLRDHKIRAFDADVIVVTKCPEKLIEAETEKLQKKLSRYSKNIVFDKIEYRNISPLQTDTNNRIENYKKVIAITGIAKPAFFVDKVSTQFEVVKHFEFRDHYQFKASDVERFRNFIGSFAAGEIAAITTEKDAMRLKDLVKDSNPSDFPLFYWEIGIELEAEKSLFDNIILKYANRT